MVRANRDRGGMALLVAAGLAAAHAVPAGAQTVGVASLDIVDAARQDPIHAEHRREWRVEVYYPAREGTGTPRRYAPDAALIAQLATDGYYDVPAERLRGWTEEASALRTAATPARADALPLITLSPGWGVAAFNYSGIAAALARQGFVVAVIDHPYIGASRLADGRFMLAGEDKVLQNEDPALWSPRIREWSQDVSRVLDRLTAKHPAGLPKGLRVDPARVTVIGHSLGGTVALQVCHEDARVRACGDFEGGPDGSNAAIDGPRRPTLFVASRSAKPDRPFVAPPLGEAPWSFLAKGDNPSRWGVVVRGGSHMSFSDAPFRMPDTLSRFGGTLMTPERSQALYTGMVVAFATAYAPGGGGNAAFRAWLDAAPEVKAARVGD